jgi:uncharacterized protein YdeI (YjbR/CyaY-like superfamily)
MVAAGSFLDDIGALRIPPDLEAAPAADPRAQARFDALSRSRKKAALWWIATARTPETRQRRVEQPQPERR